METGNTTKARCNACAGQRTHLILHIHKTKWRDQLTDNPGDDIFGEDCYELLQCAGCETITLRHASLHSMETDDRGNIKTTIAYYPPSVFRRPPKWHSGYFTGDGLPKDASEFLFICLPDFISSLVQEIYAALQNNSLRLASMGVRALLEGVIIDKIGDQRSFKANLAEFQKQGFVSEQQKTSLEATLEIGHASIHRGYAPSGSDLTYALDVTENLIQMIYINHPQASAIQNKIPKRTNP